MRKAQGILATLFVCLLVVSSFGRFGLGQEKQPLPFNVRRMRATAHLSNELLDLYFTERYSDTWRFQYRTGEWGESCYHEHFAIWTPFRGIMESESFDVISPFGAPVDNTIEAVLKAGPFEIIRRIEVPLGDENYFTIIYKIKNAGSVTEQDVRFFQTIDFDVPWTGDHTDDYGEYDSHTKSIWVVDYEFFRDKVESVPLPDAWGLDYWFTEIYQDWDDGQLNQRTRYGPGDPALGLQWNLGDLSPGEEVEIIVYVIFDYLHAPDLSIARVEINQAFQDKGWIPSGDGETLVPEDNMVPLVAGKPSVVRVFVDIGPVDGTVDNVTGVLHIFRDGQEIPGSPLAPDPALIQASKIPWDPNEIKRVRQLINKTLNFYLPPLEPGTYVAEIEIDPQNIVYESNENNNFCNFSFTMNNRREMHLAYLYVDQENRYANEERVTTAYTWLKKVYPTPQVRYVSLGYCWLPGYDVDGTDANTIRALRELLRMKEIYNLDNDPDVDVIIGWVPYGTYNGDWLGVTNALGSAMVFDIASCYQTCLAHEVGHNFGLNVIDVNGRLWPCEQYASTDDQFCHACGEIDDGDFACRCPGCGIGSGGFDVVLRTVISEDRHNFMDAAYGDEVTWVWRPSYMHLYNELSPTPRTLSRQAQKYIVISGTINQTGDVVFDKFYCLTGTTTPTEFSGGSYSLEFVDENGAILASYAFEPSFVLPEIGRVSVWPFVFVVPYPERTKYVRITHQAEAMAAKQVLSQVEVTPNAPSVTVTYPNGGEVLVGTVTVTWTANDPDGDQLTYAVLYSNDGGESWQVLAEGLQETSLELDTATLPGGDNCYIKVLATDGVNTSEDLSDGPFSVGRKAPQVFITSPEDGAVVRAGQTVVLEGVGFDLEDGIIDDSNLFWASDRDGELGTGGALAVTLSEGQHTITLTATDSDGNTVQTSVIVTAVPDTTPPSPPSNLSAIQVDTSIRLTWLPSPEEDVAGYRLHLGEGPGQYYFHRDIGNVTEYLIEDLVVGRTYYIALSAYDLIGNESELSQEIQVTIEAACTEQCSQLAQASWHMVSLPGELCPPCVYDGCGDVTCALCDDLDPCYIFYYDPDQGSYVMAPPKENICYHAGMGFWVRTYEPDVQVCVDVEVPTEDVTVPLAAAWNMIGNPFPFDVAVSGLRVRYQDQELPLLEAQAQGWVSAYLFGYDSVNGGYVVLDPEEGILEAWHGYWLRAYVECELIVPAEPAPSVPPAGALSPQDIESLGIEPPPPPPNLPSLAGELRVLPIPNPVRDVNTTVFRVLGICPCSVQALKVEIYDLAGKLVWQGEVEGPTLTWHTEGLDGLPLANGVYLYKAYVKVSGEWVPTGVGKVAVYR